MINTILITGANSGIGAALAKEYAAKSTTLILTGRDEDRLVSIKEICTQKGATVITKCIDVTDQVAMESWLQEIDTIHPIDLVIANAGIGQKEPDRKHINAVLKTNLDGVLNTLFPLIERMKGRKVGHIAAVSSLASFHAFPNRAAYSASKAAVRIFCDAWRIELKPYNISVSSIHPGFVKTPLTDRHKHAMPFLMDADSAARHIIANLRKRKPVIAFPLILFLAMRFFQCAPIFLSDSINRFLFRKELGN